MGDDRTMEPIELPRPAIIHGRRTSVVAIGQGVKFRDCVVAYYECTWACGRVEEVPLTYVTFADRIDPAIEVDRVEHQHECDAYPRDANGDLVVPGQRYREFVIGPVDDRELIAVMACRYEGDWDVREAPPQRWKKCVPIQDESKTKPED